MKLAPFDKPADQRIVDAIQSAYTAAYYLYLQTPSWRFLLRARLLREHELYLQLLVAAVESRRSLDVES
jgi:hypothetical protein